MSDAGTDNDTLTAWQKTVSEESRASEKPAAVASDLVPLLILRVGQRWIAVPAMTVAEVVLKGFVTRVPLTPAHVLGVTMIRSRLIPVVTLESMLSSSEPGELVPTLPRLVIVEAEAGEMAIVADEVRGIVDFSSASLHEESRGGTRPAWVTAELSWREELLCIVAVPQLIESVLGSGELP